MYGLVLIYFIGILFDRISVESAEIKLEAENMGGDTRNIVDRHQASGKKTVHLFKGQSLQKEICLISPTKILAIEIAYTNDGDADLVEVKISGAVVGVVHTDASSDGGIYWNIVRYESVLSAPLTIDGRRQLAIVIAEADQHGIEIDSIKLTLNEEVSPDSFECKVFCFDNIKYSGGGQQSATRGRAEQRSVQTVCAEEDNVNVPIYHDNPHKFTIKAHMPKYQTFENNRGANWYRCTFNTEYWKFTDISFVKNMTKSSEEDRLTLTIEHPVETSTKRNRKIGTVEVDFELDGPLKGSADFETGTRTVIKDVKFQGNLELRFQYLNRYNVWSAKQIKTLSQGDKETEFETPDASFREGQGNLIRLEFYSDQATNKGISIESIDLRRRWLKPEKATTVYRDSSVVIEGVDTDVWWRANESMSVTLDNTRQTFGNIHYIRVYLRVPWAESAVSQVFVLYQDGNVRLLPLTPHGLDWIPFGSSVIIGQTDQQSVRPCAPITHLHIDPRLLRIKIFYKDGGELTLRISANGSQTTVQVSDCKFAADLTRQPFVTFRSMFVQNGNADVDHVSADRGAAMPVLGSWKSLYGNYFAFYRKCISKHNTLSPDISVSILS